MMSKVIVLAVVTGLAVPGSAQAAHVAPLSQARAEQAVVAHERDVVRRSGLQGLSSRAGLCVRRSAYRFRCYGESAYVAAGGATVYCGDWYSAVSRSRVTPRYRAFRTSPIADCYGAPRLP